MNNRIMIAAPSSGSGKTMITCALLGALVERKKKVKAFKCGPDYIDPMFHRKVQNVEAENLDLYLAGEEKAKSIFEEGSRNSEISVIEGVMGLYDGLGAIQLEASSYHAASLLDCPIILVVDAKGMGRSLIPLIRGFRDYDKNKLIKGLILNRMSLSFYKRIKEMLEQETGLELLGCFPENSEFQIKSRHLGLQLPSEIEEIREKLKNAAGQMEECVNIDRILELSESIPWQKREKTSSTKNDNLKNCGEKLTLAVARDEAFCFYYDANIREFQKRGIGICYFSPLKDKKLPKEADGLLLGGGYPELYLEKLSANKEMLQEVKEAIEGKMPSLAECGGFMYLCRKIDGKEMVGVIDGECIRKKRLVNFGYIQLQEKNSYFLPHGKSIRAHEFHYYDCSANGDSCIAQKPASDRTRECVHEGKEHFWGFPHLYYPFAEEFVDHFAEEMKLYHETK